MTLTCVWRSVAPYNPNTLIGLRRAAAEAITEQSETSTEGHGVTILNVETRVQAHFT